MKKLLVLLTFLLLCISVFSCIAFYPHKVQHAVIINTDHNSITAYIGTRKTSIKTNKDFKPLTVIDYKYNLFKVYDITVVNPINDRIMTKDKSNYEVESLGEISLSSEAQYYKIDKNSKPIPCDSTSLIIGKNNVNSYTDDDGKLRTFIISPLTYANMRVAISENAFSSIYHDDIQLISTNKLRLYSLVDKFSIDIAPNTEIKLEKIAGGINLSYNNSTRFTGNRLYLEGNSIKVLNLKRGNPQFIPEYSGTLDFKDLTKGICMVNELPLEDYLKKVVPSEMPSSAGVEALKCQAVAARTYAVSDMSSSRYASLGFYVDDSTQSQVFNNSKESTKADEAITSTKGVIMTYDGNPIDAKYYSTSCGTGVPYEDVWFKPDGKSDYRPYFRTVNFIPSITTLPSTEQGWLNFYKNTSLSTIDSSSSYFRWNIKLSSEALGRSLVKSLKNLYSKNTGYVMIYRENSQLTNFPEVGNLKDISVIKRGTGGNIKSIKFSFDNADITLSEDYYIRSAFRFSSDFTGEQTTLNRLNSTPINNISFLPSSFFSIEKSGNFYIIYGGGYGHGVGMSQFGAMNLSDRGWDYKKILNIYYKNIQYTKLN